MRGTHADLRRRGQFALAVLIVLSATPAEAVRRRAFVTSVAGSGNLASWPDAGGNAGLAAGDVICQARAAAAGLPDPGAYRAWLSTATTDAWCHVQGYNGKRGTNCGSGSLPGGGPWYLVNGITNFTGSLDELTGPERRIYRPVVYDESGQALTDAIGDRYWTGTMPDGASAADTCGGWTSSSGVETGQAGHPLGSALLWSADTTSLCSDVRRLLCLETGASETWDLGWSPGSLVFVTSATGKGDLAAWPQAGGQTGIAAGDAICRNLAAAAHLPAPESFFAWLSDSLVDAADRLTSNGPYRRVDAYTVAGSKADLLDGSTSNSIHVTESGAYLVDAGRSWTGTRSDGLHASDDCTDWEYGGVTDYGEIGVAALARSGDWTQASFERCAYGRHLLCFSNVVVVFWDGFESGDTARWSSAAP